MRHRGTAQARIAKAIEPAHRDSAHAATAHDRIAETAMPSVRTTFSLALGHRLAESARSGDPLSLILVRIDNYQAVYDHYGLQASNQILDAAGTFFVGSVREMDWVARFDRTTFAFLLPRTAHANALRVAERMRTHKFLLGPLRERDLDPAHAKPRNDGSRTRRQQRRHLAHARRKR